MTEQQPTPASVETDSDRRPLRILEGLFGEAEKILAKANRRLQRAGVDQRFELTVIGTEVQEEDDPEDEGMTTSVTYLICKLSHPIIAAEGWEFIAKAEWSEDVQDILVRTNPDAENLDDLPLPTALVCEHCNTNRNRRKCFLIRHTETGEIKTVGATCVAPFLGLSVMALWWLDGSLDGEIMDLAPNLGIWRASRGTSSTNALALAWAASDGGRAYVSSTGWRPTRNTVADAIWPPRRENYEDKVRRLALIEEAEKIKSDTDLIDAIRASAATLDSSSPYGDTMQKLAAAEFCSIKNLGYLVSLVRVHRRVLDGIAREERKIAHRATITSGLYAPENSVIEDVEAVVTGVNGYVSHFGYSSTSGVFIQFRVQTGHQLKWASTSKLALSLEIGDRVHIAKATIKALDTYEGIDSTMLSRPKVEKIEQEESPS